MHGSGLMSMRLRRTLMDENVVRGFQLSAFSF
jgi:hypothetical protein